MVHNGAKGLNETCFPPFSGPRNPFLRTKKVLWHRKGSFLPFEIIFGRATLPGHSEKGYWAFEMGPDPKFLLTCLLFPKMCFEVGPHSWRGQISSFVRGVLLAYVNFWIVLLTIYLVSNGPFLSWILAVTVNDGYFPNLRSKYWKKNSVKRKQKKHFHRSENEISDELPNI